MEIEKIVQATKKIVLRFGSHEPILYITGTKGEAIAFLDVHPEEHETKEELMFCTGKNLSGIKAVGSLTNLFLVSEAWMGTTLDMRPSEDPNRVEVLLVSRLDVLKNEESIEMFAYVRDRMGNLIELKPLPLPPGGSSKGRLLPAFVAGYTGSM